MRQFACGLALVVAPLLAGCGDDTIQIGPQPLDLDAEQVAAIRSADKQIDDEEGGAQKVIRPTKVVKTAKKGG